MPRQPICTVVCALLLALAASVHAATFELLPTYDTYVSNDPSEGPIGAMNRPVTAGRSIAVDPEFTPLGAPV